MIAKWRDGHVKDSVVSGGDVRLNSDVIDLLCVLCSIKDEDIQVSVFVSVSGMDDFNFDSLDLGSRRKPTNWVAVAPPMVYRNKINPNKR